MLFFSGLNKIEYYFYQKRSVIKTSIIVNLAVVSCVVQEMHTLM